MRRKTKLKGITKAAYAKSINVTRQMVSSYIDLGMPTLPGGRIDPDKADEWRRKNLNDRTDESFSEARRRKESALASLRELELRKVNGELVELQTVKTTLADIFRQHRDALLNIAERMSAPLAFETDPGKVHGLISTEIREHLNELADALENK
jgi:hypothetical protein